jgi:hypothetical protein
MAIKQRRWGADWTLSAMFGIAVACLPACSGGGSGGGETEGISLRLAVTLTGTGTHLTCDTSTPGNYAVVRETNGTSVTGGLPCPSTQAFKGDWTLSRWSAFPKDGTNSTPLASTLTQLPAPVVVRDGQRWVVFAHSPLTEGRVPNVKIQSIGANDVEGLPLEADSRGWVSVPVSINHTSATGWRWHKQVGNDVFVSAPTRPVGFTPTDLDFWGALAIGDVFASKTPVLAGTQVTNKVLSKVEYASIGLQSLFVNRQFRDLRFVDLNNDGLDDVVSNVYGAGCAMIGLQVSVGKYNFFEPKRNDGTCIGGHGETLLVADFNSDGLVDIFLPSYERFDFLQNQGDGKFVERAAALGISFPNYVPQVEGAAAVDVDLDGHIDIVVAGEVLINDRAGGFKPRFLPFGIVPMFDEGLSVVDLDADGLFDIVKHNPWFGPRVFWGLANRVAFQDSGYFFNGTVNLNSSFGLASGYYTGRALQDLFFASGSPVGNPPWMCSQLVPRRFECMAQAVPNGANRGADLLLVADVDNDGINELVSRETSMRVYSSGLAPANLYRFDLLDAKGMRNRFGTTARAHCVSDDSLVGMGFVDGGNGLLAQGNYTLSFQSTWCTSVFLDVARPGGMVRMGPFKAGMHSVLVS